jgi:hypothetical protein
MTNRKALGAVTLTALLLVTAGCGGKKGPGNAANATQTAEGNAGTEAANQPVPEVDANSEATTPGTGEAAENDTTPVKNLIAAHNGGVVRIGPARIPGPPVRVAARGALSRYVDMHPREVEDGRSFLGEATVRQAIAASVHDSGVRNFIYHYDGPDAPIARTKSGRILAWGCEAHNCGFHNWAVSITPDGASAEVCYYRDDDRPDGSATWYSRGGRTVKRAGNCPDE